MNGPPPASKIVLAIERGVAEMELGLPAGAAARLARFLELLHKWNHGQNLTAITDIRTMVPGHVLDSLSGLPWVRGERLLDLGAGAGLPGIPLAVVVPERHHVLLDSRRKRIQFLVYIKAVLKLDNVDVQESRLEKYRPDEKFDTLTARAFAPLPKLIHMTMPFTTTGGRLVAWQGHDPSAALVTVLDDLALERTVHPVRVPGIRAPRHIAVIERGKPLARRPRAGAV